MPLPSNQTAPWSRQFAHTPACDPPVTKSGHNHRGTPRTGRQPPPATGPTTVTKQEHRRRPVPHPRRQPGRHPSAASTGRTGREAVVDEDPRGPPRPPGPAAAARTGRRSRGPPCGSAATRAAPRRRSSRSWPSRAVSTPRRQRARAGHGHQSAQPVPAGDDDETARRAGQQRPYLTGVPGVVQQDQHAAPGQHGPQTRRQRVLVLGEFKGRDTQRLQQGAQCLRGRDRGAHGGEAAQVEVELPVREARGDPAAPVNGECRLADTGGTADHDGGGGRVDLRDQRGGLVELGLPSDETRQVGGELCGEGAGGRRCDGGGGLCGGVRRPTRVGVTWSRTTWMRSARSCW